MSDDHRICFVGDSYVQGTSDPDCQGWVGRVSASARRRGYDITAYNLGVRRDTSADIAARWQTEVDRRFQSADIVPYIVFSFGINDCTVDADGRRVEQQQTLEIMYEMLVAARARAAVVFVGPAPIADLAQNARIARLSSDMAGIAQRASVPFLELFNELIDDPQWMREVADVDGSHPGAVGYQKLADRVEAWPAWWFREAPSNR